MSAPAEVALAADQLEALAARLAAPSGAAHPLAHACTSAVLALLAQEDAWRDLDALQRARARVEELATALDGSENARHRAATEQVSSLLTRVFELARGGWSPAEEPAAESVRPFAISLVEPQRRSTPEVASTASPRKVRHQVDPPPRMPVLDVDALFAEALALEDGQPFRPLPPEPAPPPQPEPPWTPLRKPSGDVATSGRAGERAQMRRHARTCLEEIGALGLHRTMDADELWDPRRRSFDERLLAHFDALCALAHPVPGGGETFELIAEVERYRRDAVVDDPFRAFSTAFVLAQHDGPDKLRAALHATPQWGPAAIAATGRALALSSHSHLTEGLAKLCRESHHEPTLAMALRVARRVGADLGGAVEPLLHHPDTVVAVAATRALVVRGSGSVERLLQIAWEDVDEDVLLAAVDGIVVLDPVRARDVVVQRLEDLAGDAAGMSHEGRDRLVRRLALVGEASDLALLERSSPREAVVLEALGWFGHPDGVARLLAHADHEAARQSLGRLLGGEATDAAGWRARVEALSLPPGRIRRGRPFHPHQIVDELLEAGVPQRRRRWLELELSSWLGRPALDVDDWIARQESVLSVVRQELAERPAGVWRST